MKKMDYTEWSLIFRNTLGRCETVLIPQHQEGKFIIGRDTIKCLEEHARVSVNHAAIRRIDHEWFIEDMGSKCGVYVNRRKLKSEKYKITIGDIITLSKTNPLEEEYFDVLFCSRKINKASVDSISQPCSSSDERSPLKNEALYTNWHSRRSASQETKNVEVRFAERVLSNSANCKDVEEESKSLPTPDQESKFGRAKHQETKSEQEPKSNELPNYSSIDELIVISDDDDYISSSQNYFCGFIKKEEDTFINDSVLPRECHENYPNYQSEDENQYIVSNSNISDAELINKIIWSDDSAPDISNKMDEGGSGDFENEAVLNNDLPSCTSNEKNDDSLHTEPVKKRKKKICYTDAKPLSYKPKYSRGRGEWREEEGNKKYKDSSQKIPAKSACNNEMSKNSSNRANNLATHSSPKKKPSTKDKVRRQYGHRIPIPGGGNDVRVNGDNPRRYTEGTPAQSPALKIETYLSQNYGKEYLAGNEKISSKQNLGKDEEVKEFEGRIGSRDTLPKEIGRKKRKKTEKKNVKENKQTSLESNDTFKHFKIPKKKPKTVNSLPQDVSYPAEDAIQDPSNHPAISSPERRRTAPCSSNMDTGLKEKNNNASKASSQKENNSSKTPLKLSSEIFPTTSDQNIVPKRNNLEINQCNVTFDITSITSPKLNHLTQIGTPLSLTMDYSSRYHIPNTDEIKYIIFLWNCAWLKEQHKQEGLPPLLRECRFLPSQNLEDYKVKLSYESYEEYVNTYVSLMLQELWEEIRFFTFGKKTFHCGINSIQNTDTFTTISCQSIINIKSQSAPKEGDLIIMDLRKEGSFVKVFGFLLKCQIHGRKIDFPYIHPVLEKRFEGKEEEQCVLSLEIQIGRRHHVIDKKKITLVEPVTSLDPKLCQFTALYELHKSKLLKCLLNPVESSCKVTHNRRKNLAKYNNSQNSAIYEISHSVFDSEQEPQILMVQGPPGTGKTHTIIGMLDQLFSRNPDKKILILAPSDAAVDEIGRRLIEFNSTNRRKIAFIRIGQKDHVIPSLHEYCLDQLMLEDHLNFRRQRIIDGKDYKERISGIKRKNQERLKKANAILSTVKNCQISELKTLVSKDLLKFSCCIIDEATQCTEPELLLAVCYNINKLILVGDRKQQPSVRSKSAIDCKFKLSLFERLSAFYTEKFNRNPAIVLTLQYRMHPKIASFLNMLLYEDQLITDQSAGAVNFTLKPFMIFAFNQEKTSKTVIHEVVAGFVSKLTSDCLKMISSTDTVGVMTPYIEECDYLKEMLNVEDEASRVEINTIDKYRGREKDVVILLSVHIRDCQNRDETEFACSEQMLNIALTRARRTLIIICDLTHLCQTADLRSFVRRAKDCIFLMDSKDDPALFIKNQLCSP